MRLNLRTLCPGACLALLSLNAVQALEEPQDLRLGLCLIDGEGQVLSAHRESERFALTSTFKALACARVFEEGRGEEPGKAAMGGQVSSAPVFEKFSPEKTVSLSEACEAALRVSDNRAANFVLSLTVGPEKLTAWLRKWGDHVTRVDDYEPEINAFPEGKAGEERNSTTPLSAVELWRRLDREMEATARGRWLQAMAGGEVSGTLLRALLPENWQVYDRTGAGAGTRALHARVVSPEGEVYYLAAHVDAFKDRDLSLERRDELLRTLLQEAVKVMEERAAR